MLGKIESMKISVNTPDDLVVFVDAQVQAGYFPSRSAAIADAISRWRVERLEASYDQAFAQIDPVWDATTGDGLLNEDDTE